MEPLSLYISETHTLSGIEIGGQNLKIALFADDVLLFLAKPTTDLPTLKTILGEYHSYSGLKLLPLQPHKNPTWITKSPFRITNNHIKYLGNNIVKTPNSL